jgi:ABC-type lipoprotein release transport system permease subunit
MAEGLLDASHASVRARATPLTRIALIAWRNLWRNSRRTWLTAGGVAFSIWLLVFARSMQDGALGMMVDNAARLATGHIQLQDPRYLDDPRVEYILHGAPALRDELARDVAITVAVMRAQAFALVSVDERSYGAQIVGVEPSAEAVWSSLTASGVHGRYLEQPGEVFMGALLARNLGATLGDDVVMLGTGVDGSVAAAAATLVGTFESGQADFDRAFAQIHIDDFREAWSLAPDEAHAVVALAERVASSEAAAVRFAAHAPEGVRVLAWQDLMPEAVQSMDMKMVSTELFFALVAIIVTFSVVNAFVMTVFERAPEFGMLIAIGMRRGLLVGLLQIEALCLCALGIALGVGVSTVLIALLDMIGVPLPEAAASIASRFNLPSRIYPVFQGDAAVFSSVVMLVATQLAALAAGLRLRRLDPVAALHARG